MLSNEQWLLEQKGVLPLKKWQRTVNLLAEVFNAPAGFIVQHTSEGFQATIASEQEENPYPAESYIPIDTNIFCKKIVETGKTLYVPHAQIDPQWDTNPEVHDDGFSSYLGMPIRWPDRSIYGTICVMDFQVTDYQSTYIRLMEELRDLVESDLLLIQQFNQAKELAMSDGMTQLNNRRGFFALTQQYLHLSERYKNPLMLIYLDIDCLKTLNDKFGHHIGDQVIKALADCIKQNVRKSDICARLGGDEFVIIANTNNMASVEKICQKIEGDFRQCLPQGATNVAGVSYGIIAIDDNQKDLSYWLNEADKRMYQHKNTKKL